eukprot:GHVO01043800.1.p1 GENE.GHVO01043800.1~~GHVO01043800.1.p1  ORF type:complete len:504 (+),score=90.60 GHVO01043800.1:22-1512(+)
MTVKPESSPSSEATDAESFFGDTIFSDLPISDGIKKAIKEMGIEKTTEIQALAIPRLLEGHDVLGAARTGSGKTLAFLVPTFDHLFKAKMTPKNGTGALIITPTRELAMQIHDVATDLGKYMPQTHALVIGGANRKLEAQKLVKGANIVIGTPGRIVDHLNGTKGFQFQNLLMLIIDEADRMLQIGFEEEMNAIINTIPKDRQSALFSATQTAKVADLARLSLKKPMLVKVKEQVSSAPTVAGLTQGYVVCPAEDRFSLLYAFLKKNSTKKVMVFFSSCMCVKFYEEVLTYIDVNVSSIHGKKKQSSRMSTYYEFCQAPKGTLLCTDVAARGLDIPKVDWIVQFDPPDDPKEYIHRVGRTARGLGGTGKALLFLMPSEMGFLNYLKLENVPLKEFIFKQTSVPKIQTQFENIIEKNYYLHRSSREAYRTYIHAYAAHSLKDIYNVHKLDLQKTAKAFGFSSPPKVDLQLSMKSGNGRKRKTTNGQQGQGQYKKSKQ